MNKSLTESTNRLSGRIPARVWFAVGGLLAAAFWMQQHDARIRQQAGLQQLRNGTAAETAALRRQAAEDMRQANVQNAQAVAKFEQRRQQLEQQSRQLAAQLDLLRKQAQIQAGEAATLPISEIVTRVVAQLGLKAEDVAAARTADIANTATSAPASRGSFADMAKGATSEPPGRGALGAPAGGQSPPLQNRAALELSDSGARKVEASLVALNACRAESTIQTQQASNCQARAEADQAAIQKLNGSVASLNQALAAKDTILVEQQSEYKAELRAARGTFLGRLARVTEHVAIGVAVGVAIGAAVK